MDTHLCHTCFQRNEVEALKCDHCGVILRENKKEKMVQEILKTLSRVEKRNRLQNYKSYYISLTLQFILSIHLFILGLSLSNWDPSHLIELNLTIYEFSFYGLSAYNLYNALRLFARRAVTTLKVILIPVEIALQAKFVIKVTQEIKSIYDQLPLSSIEYLQEIEIPLTIYAIVLALIYAIQFYFLTFSYQVKRCVRRN
ncbi:MAG: hypothetical protein INQ03_14545 [Candidatus Heimdallarchaeota archaeon]|nr:hypothetical protein [Candidatus Heimdallarchaeota archaeon]